MTTTMNDSPTNWNTCDGPRTELDSHKNDIRELLSAVKVLCIQLDNYNNLTKQCIDSMTEEQKAKSEGGPQMMLLIGEITTKRAMKLREKMMKSLNIGEEGPLD